jgi:tetratricopeptide (TPR) repeat protein
VNVERLQSNIAWAVAHGLGARDLIPMLERLIRHAPAGSDCKISAQRQLAELIVEHAPWRAALLTRDVLQHKDDDRAWALFGLAHTLLGNHRVARRAYSRALARAPGCASYAHNLGHLIDVAFDQPREALRWLKQAHGYAPDEEEIAASYAHALARCGQLPEAIAVLERVLHSRAKAVALLQRWLTRRNTVPVHHSAGGARGSHAAGTARGSRQSCTAAAGSISALEDSEAPESVELGGYSAAELTGAGGHAAADHSAPPV